MYLCRRWEGRLHQFVHEVEALTPHAVRRAWLGAYACVSCDSDICLAHVRIASIQEGASDDTFNAE